MQVSLALEAIHARATDLTEWVCDATVRKVAGSRVELDGAGEWKKGELVRVGDCFAVVADQPAKLDDAARVDMLGEATAPRRDES